jgi:hypothetical protein
MTNRKLAIEWWNKLPFNSSNTEISKTHYCLRYFLGRDYKSLTGREIEFIWMREH